MFGEIPMEKRKTPPFLRFSLFFGTVRYDDIPSYTFFAVFGVCGAPLTYDLIIHEHWKILDQSLNTAFVPSSLISLRFKFCVLGLFDDLVASSVQSLSHV